MAVMTILALPWVSFGAGDKPVFHTDWQISGGYRLDELDWSIAGNADGTDPDILSELSWRDLEIFQFGLSARVDAGRPDKTFFAHGRASLDYGWIRDGENRDSDYNGDGRTLEWSRSINDAGDGEVYDISIGGGPGLCIGSGRMTIIPLAGFSFHRQNLVLQDGVQVLSDPAVAPAGFMPVPLGPIAGLDSHYEAEWRGPWAGIELRWSPMADLRLVGGFEYHWVDYDAEARWNLRTDLAQPVSFSHDADGTGTVAAIGAEYSLPGSWTLGLSARVQKWKTDHGNDRVFFPIGSPAITRLNEVEWESSALMVEVSRSFFKSGILLPKQEWR